MSYRKVIKIYEACWKDNEQTLPPGVNADDVYQLKTILEAHRKSTGSINKHSLFLESNLIERAAELGNNMAISLLCGRTLSDAAAIDDDKEHAVKLLDELCGIGFGPAFKIKADIAYKFGHVSKAEELYQSCLDAKLSSELNSVKIECLRSIGVIRFNGYDLDQSKLYFQLAIAEAERPDQVMDCHFYLSQIVEQDKNKSRYHLEQAARHGLKQAFAPLGFLLLNYFNKPELALEWFELGNSIGDFNSGVGLFDVSIRNGNIESAQKVLTNIKKFAPDEATLDHFLTSRRESVARVISRTEPDSPKPETPLRESKGRWDF